MLQHHVQRPFPGMAVPVCTGPARLFQQLRRPALGDKEEGEVAPGLGLPPAGEGEGLLEGDAVHLDRDGEPGPQLRLHPDDREELAVGRRLIRPFRREGTGGGGRIHHFGVGRVHIVDLGVDAVFVFAAQLPGVLPDAVPGDAGSIFEDIHLFRRQRLEGAVRIPARLSEVGLLEAVVDRQEDGEEGGKQESRQPDGQRRDDAPAPFGGDFAQGQFPDDLPVFDFHPARPLTR